MTKIQFKIFVKDKTETMAFDYLVSKKLEHKKERKLNHTKIEMAEYLEPNYHNI